MRDTARRALPVAARAAYAAAALNGLAALVMATALRPGLTVPGRAAAERQAYVADHRLLWGAGWLAWHAAAASLLCLYVALALRWWRRGPARCMLALLLAGGGLAVDMGAQAMAMAALPQLSGVAYASAERLLSVMTGYLANGLYTVAGALLVWAGWAELPRRLALLSLPVWAAGAALSAASLVGSDGGQVAASAALFPLLVLWCAGVGRWLARSAS